MTAPVLTWLEGRFPIRRHEHVAVLYRGCSEAFRQASFLAEGLWNGDLCQYLAPVTLHTEMLRHLRTQVSNLDRYLKSGILRLRRGTSDLMELTKWRKQVFTDAENMRVPAVRWLEEGSWPEPAGLSMPHFFEFHALLNYQVKHYPSAAVCQYSLDEIEARHLLDVISVHRHLLLDGTLVRDNPFYLPAEGYTPTNLNERESSLLGLFREVGFDVEKLLEAIAGYGRLGERGAV